jgi:tryptophanyl-tRNA synthetase
MKREIAIKFNHQFGEVLELPEPQIREEGAVVPGTDGQKMSKSYGNTIPLFGAEAATKKAIMGIVSDSRGMNDPKDPDTCVIFQIHKLFLSAAEQKALADEYQNGLPYGEAKKRLLQAYLDFTAPMRAKREALEKNPKELERVAADGAKKAAAVAQATMERVRSAVGLR